MQARWVSGGGVLQAGRLACAKVLGHMGVGIVWVETGRAGDGGLSNKAVDSCST